MLAPGPLRLNVFSRVANLATCAWTLPLMQVSRGATETLAQLPLEVLAHGSDAADGQTVARVLGEESEPPACLLDRSDHVERTDR